MLENIATPAQTTQTQTGRPDLPPLTPYNAVSIWVKTSVDEESGEVTVDASDLRTFSHPIGKTGAGLNAAFDRILKSIHDRGDKGFGSLEGYKFEALAVVPVQA